MEYVHDHGPYDDIPFEELMRSWRASYSRVLKHSGNFDTEK